MAYVNWRDAYFESIAMTLDTDGRRRKLLKALHAVPFTWTVPMDENRAARGRSIRLDWWNRNADTEGLYPLDLVQEPCTFLEFLLGLAKDMEFTLRRPEIGDRTAVWFWDIVKNMALDWATDDVFDEPVANLVQARCHDICARRFSPNGQGGLFPLKNPPENQQETEFWYQLNWYVRENYVDSDGEYM